MGRTGRAGRAGKAILLVTPRERSWLRTLERATNSPMEPYELPTPAALQKLRQEQFESQLMGFTEDGKLAKAMGLLDDIAERNDMDMAMLAGALACWMESAQPGSLPLETPSELPIPSANPPRGKGGPGGKRSNFRKGGPGGKPGGYRGNKPGGKPGSRPAGKRDGFKPAKSRQAD